MMAPAAGRPRRARVLTLLGTLLLCLPAPLASQDDGTGHVRLSLSAEGNVVVAWTAPAPLLDGLKPDANSTCVRYAPWGSGLGGSPISLSRNVLQWRARYWSAAELPGLAEGAEYAYQCSEFSGFLKGHAGSAEGYRYGPQLRLRAPRLAPQAAPAAGPAREGVPTRGVRLAVFGDLAEGKTGGELIQRVVEGPRLDAVLHLGDIAGNLTSERFEKGDRFLTMIEPVASMVPYMTLLGDQDELKAYMNFFVMPSQGGDPWYSFGMGDASFVMLWTGGLSDAGSEAERQVTWLRSELARLSARDERSRRPWLIVAGHHPLYCSMGSEACGSEAAALREVLEPLLLEHGVDLYLGGHMHAYERTYPVAKGTICRESGAASVGRSEGRELCGPVFVVNGDAGEPALEYETVAASWTAKRHWGTPGHGELTIHNATHLQYRQLEVDNELNDEFWVVKGAAGPDALAQTLEESFLEAVGWAAFATFVVGLNLAFVSWAHSDGLEKRHLALRDLRNELRVLGVSEKIIGREEDEQDLTQQQEDSGLH